MDSTGTWLQNAIEARVRRDMSGQVAEQEEQEMDAGCSLGVGSLSVSDPTYFDLSSGEHQSVEAAASVPDQQQSQCPSGLPVSYGPGSVPGPRGSEPSGKWSGRSGPW